MNPLSKLTNGEKVIKNRYKLFIVFAKNWHKLGNPEETAKSTFSVNPGTFVDEANEAAEHDDEAAVYEDEK